MDVSLFGDCAASARGRRTPVPPSASPPLQHCYLFMLCSCLLCLKWSRTSLHSVTPSPLGWERRERIKESRERAPLPFLIPEHLLSKNPLRSCTRGEGEIPRFSIQAVNLRIIFGAPLRNACLTLSAPSLKIHTEAWRRRQMHKHSQVYSFTAIYPMTLQYGASIPLPAILLRQRDRESCRK